MKWAHSITLTAFAKPEDDSPAIKEALEALAPLDLEKEKLKTETEKSSGYDGRSILVHKITLTKEKHVNAFLQFMLDNLTEEQKATLIEQKETRLDEEYNFFVRFQKEQWMHERKLELTDTGSCFHLKITLATYPKNKESALALIDRLLTQKNI